MNQTPPKKQIKLNRRGLTELVLMCAFLSLFTFAIWSWMNKGGYVAAMDGAAPSAEVSLMPQILRHPAIMLSTVVTEFILLLALILAIVPISWWLRADHLMAGDNLRVMTPLRWLGEKLRILRAPAEPVAGEYVMSETGELVFVPQPNANGEDYSQQEVVMVEQPDGTLLAMVQQGDGTMVPAESAKSAEGQTESTEPLLPLPEQTSDVLNFEEQEEDPLADLADIGDILSSAFDEDVAIDPERAAFSRSLADIDVMELLQDARNVLATFQQ